MCCELLYLSYNCSPVEHWDAVVSKPKVDSPWMATAKSSTPDRKLHLLVGLPWVINGPRPSPAGTGQAGRPLVHVSVSRAFRVFPAKVLGVCDGQP